MNWLQSTIAAAQLAGSLGGEPHLGENITNIANNDGAKPEISACETFANSSASLETLKAKQAKIQELVTGIEKTLEMNGLDRPTDEEIFDDNPDPATKAKIDAYSAAFDAEAEKVGYDATAHFEITKLIGEKQMGVKVDGIMCKSEKIKEVGRGLKGIGDGLEKSLGKLAP